MSLDNKLSVAGSIPPDEPPVRKGGLHWWQTALIAVGVPTLGFLGFLGYNALKPQQTVPVSTPTPVVATATPAPTATYTPTPTQTPQPTPTAMPVPTATPAVSQYRQQALEDIARISQFEPTIATLIPQADWFNNRGVDAGEAQFIRKIRDSVELGNYITGTIVHKENPVTNVLVLGADKDTREQSLIKTQQYLPQVADLLKIDYKKPLLMIDIYPGGGGSGFRNVNITRTEDLEHELVHTVYETSRSEEVGLAQIPAWVGEGVPEIIRGYLKGGAPLVEIGRKNIGTTRDARGIGPLFDMTLTPSSRPGGGPVQAVYEGGFYLLAEYANLAGYDNLWAAVHDIHEDRLAKNLLPTVVITHKDLENITEGTVSIVKQQHEAIRTILAKNVPLDKQNDFNQMYQTLVYGQ